MPMRTVMATDADLGDDLVEVLDVLGDPRGHRPRLRQLLSAVQSQADPEQPPDDVLVQIPGDPVPIGGHLQFECAARLSARCTVGQAGDVARYVVGEHRAGGGPADRDSAAADQIRAVTVADGELAGLPVSSFPSGHPTSSPTSDKCDGPPGTWHSR